MNSVRFMMYYSSICSGVVCAYGYKKDDVLEMAMGAVLFIIALLFANMSKRG